MKPEAVLMVRMVAAVIFVGSLYAGYYMLKNLQKLFGPDPDMPSEGPSSRAYRTALVFIVWGHVLIASGGFALMFH